jgi:hypothetical protein
MMDDYIVWPSDAKICGSNPLVRYAKSVRFALQFRLWNFPQCCCHSFDLLFMLIIDFAVGI